MKGTTEAAGRGDGPGRLGSRKAKGESWRACVFEAKRKGCDYGEYFMEPEIGDYSAHSVSAALDECRAPSETAAGRESEAETETERARRKGTASVPLIKSAMAALPLCLPN